MKVYLVRHAHAIAGHPDALRPLSAKGRRQIRKMAGSFTADNGFAPVEIWHSPLLRAVDTARRVAKIAGVSRLRETPGLCPNDDPRIVAKRLGKIRRPVAIVGHEPQLSALATVLLGGRAETPVVIMRKGALLTLERTAGRFRIAALVAPDHD